MPRRDRQHSLMFFSGGTRGSFEPEPPDPADLARQREILERADPKIEVPPPRKPFDTWEAKQTELELGLPEEAQAKA